jgi:hypothetical protein
MAQVGTAAREEQDQGRVPSAEDLAAVATELFGQADDLELSTIGPWTPLTADDLFQHVTEGPERSGASELKHIRAQHHAIARLLAIGTQPVAVAAIIGVTPAAITTMQRSAAFQELLEFYMESTAQTQLDLHDKMHHTAEMFLDSLQRDIREREDEISFDSKRGALKDLLSFTGYQQAAKQVVVRTGGLDADDIALVKARTINVTAIRRDSAGGPQDPDSGRAALSAGGAEDRGSGPRGAVDGEPAPPAESGQHVGEAAEGEEV